MLYDVLGREINLGDKVAYPTHDYSMRSQTVVGEVRGVKLRRKNRRVYNSVTNRWDLTQVDVPVVTIKTTRRSSGHGGGVFSVNAVTTVEKIENLVKVA